MDLDFIAGALEGTARLAVGIGLLVAAGVIYLSPLIVAIYYQTVAPAVLIGIMMVANLGVVLFTPALVGYAASAVLWSACAIIAAIAAIASEAISSVVQSLKRPSEQATSQG